MFRALKIDIPRSGILYVSLLHFTVYMFGIDVVVLSVFRGGAFTLSCAFLFRVVMRSLGRFSCVLSDGVIWFETATAGPLFHSKA